MLALAEVLADLVGGHRVASAAYFVFWSLIWAGLLLWLIRRIRESRRGEPRVSMRAQPALVER